jgi:phage shock protein PspC (stress-responsive transcriptional regulator)
MNIWENLKNLTKSSKDSWLGGVCGGLGAATPVPSWMWRAAFLFAVLAYGVGFLLYLVLWICVPSGRTRPQARSST